MHFLTLFIEKNSLNLLFFFYDAVKENIDFHLFNYVEFLFGFEFKRMGWVEEDIEEEIYYISENIQFLNQKYKIQQDV